MAERLPEAGWTRREDLAALIRALGAGQARYVGGAVRDTLLGEPAKDIDIATPLRPDAVVARLAAARIRAVPTGIAHGTVTAVLRGGSAEITTLRKDVATDGRHATIVFATDWRTDAARRDFTINALYADPLTGEVFDYFDGIEDLRAGRVRFIGDPRQRIREDHLRILRYFRFQARFGSEPADDQAESACHDLAPTLMGLSRERVGMELMALLALPDPAHALARMAALGVLGQVLPEASPEPLADLIAAERREHVAPAPVRRLAALLPPDPSIAETVAARLRLSNPLRRRLTLGAARTDRIGDARALAYEIGREETIDRLLLAGRDLAPLHEWAPPRFALKGGEIVALGVTAGPEVARVLRAVEARWAAEGFPDRARIDVLLAAELAARRAVKLG